MALRRQARKAAFWRLGAGPALATVLWIIAAALPIGAATTEYVVVDRIYERDDLLLLSGEHFFREARRSQYVSEEVEPGIKVIA